jgi:hypothetical protein
MRSDQRRSSSPRSRSKTGACAALRVQRGARQPPSLDDRAARPSNPRSSRTRRSISDAQRSRGTQQPFRLRCVVHRDFRRLGAGERRLQPFGALGDALVVVRRQFGLRLERRLVARDGRRRKAATYAFWPASPASARTAT